MLLEILNFTLMLFCPLKGRKCAEIAALPGIVFLA